MKQSLYSMAMVMAVCFMLCSCGRNTDNAKVVATTSWTAAYAKAAGIDNVVLLSPMSMVHPSEYELSIADIEKIKNSELIVCAGYEIMTSHIVQLLNDSSKIIRVNTIYDPETIRKSVMSIAGKFSTEDIALRNVEEIEAAFDSARALVERERLDTIPTLVHLYQKSLAQNIGLNVVGVFGPQSPESYEIVELMSSHAGLVIDNIHNPVGEIFCKSTGIPYIQWLNFPGMRNTSNLCDVINMNVSTLTQTVSPASR